MIAKYEREQQVRFTVKDENGKDHTYDGVIYVVDENGTIEQHTEPSYDIMALVEGEKFLFKHIRESLVTER